MAIVGLKNLYYAELTQDTPAGAAYDVPVRISGAIEANINPNASVDTLFADDAPYEVAATLGKITVEIRVADLPQAVYAFLLGHTISQGVVASKSSDTPPWVALGFQSLKSNNYYKYVWLLKGKFMEPEQTHETKGESINFQTPTITGNFVAREYDAAWKLETSEDAADYSAAVGEAWFDAVGATPDVTPLTVEVTPEDGASAVVASSNIVWTFNKTIQVSTITSANFMLIKATNGTVIPGTLTKSTTEYPDDTVTFNPTSNLDPATAYVAIATTNIKDLSGNHLEEASITTFTVTT